MRKSLFVSCLAILSAACSFAQTDFSPGDWTSYKDFRFALAMDLGPHDLFIATSGGVLAYNIFKHTWYDPTVVGYGQTEAVELDDPVLLLFDQKSGYLWVATKTQLLTYDTNFDVWRRVQKDLWGPLDRVVNLGTGAGGIYVETLPGTLFSTIYPPGFPLPSPNWPQHITRYVGGSGSFSLDSGPEPEHMDHWRGLRSRVKIDNKDLFGALGMPPAGFPAVMMPAGWIWNSDGTVTDPHLKRFPVTDWMIDSWGNLWTTHWGAGIVRTDLRSQRAEIFQSGPAGNDVRAIFLDGSYDWIGGDNRRDDDGVTRASADLKEWQYFQTREISRIRSTDVFDFAKFDGLLWIATNEGLLSYQEEKGTWNSFGVSKNLHSDEIRALAATDSELWIGTSRGLAVMTRPGHEIWRVANEGIELNGVLDLAVCEDTLYVSTSAGIFKGKLKDRKLFYAPLDPGLLAAAVPEMSVYGTEVWAVTDQGMMRYNQKDGHSKSWLASVWMNNAKPTAILATQKFVWIGTENKGFYRYNPASGEWTSYDRKDGLLSNHIQVIRRDGDDLLIGTTDGITRFYWNRPDHTR